MLWPIPARAGRRLRVLLGAWITANRTPAPGTLSTVQTRGLRASVSIGQKSFGTPAGYSNLTREDLDKGLQREVEKSHAHEPFDIEYLRESLARRPRQATYDYLTPGHSHLLNIALWDALPPEARAGNMTSQRKMSASKEASACRFLMPSASMGDDDGGRHDLPSGHHLVYFPLQRPISLLEPDGTDPAQSPGSPFVRRMWAGGALDFRGSQNMQLDGGRAVCVERLDTQNMVLRGGWGREKIFIDVIRRYGAKVADIDPSSCTTTPERLLALENKVWENADLEERRTLVFMRAKDDVPGGDVSVTAKTPSIQDRIIRSSREPEYSFSFTPTPTLLFQFSALTYNAHAIHLDLDYCRNVEGHRALLVHGPLTLLLMLSAIRSRIPGRRFLSSRFIRKFEYRNIAPLYAGEELRVSVRCNGQQGAAEESSANEPFCRWDVWVENSRGGICARGTAITRA